MKEQRGLSGIYFRSKDEDGKWGNVVFEDLSEQEQDKIMDAKDIEYVKSLAKMLANTINKLGEHFDISSK